MVPPTKPTFSRPLFNIYICVCYIMTNWLMVVI